MSDCPHTSSEHRVQQEYESFCDVIRKFGIKDFGLRCLLIPLNQNLTYTWTSMDVNGYGGWERKGRRGRRKGKGKGEGGNFKNIRIRQTPHNNHRKYMYTHTIMTHTIIIHINHAILHTVMTHTYTVSTHTSITHQSHNKHTSIPTHTTITHTNSNRFRHSPQPSLHTLPCPHNGHTTDL